MRRFHLNKKPPRTFKNPKNLKCNSCEKTYRSTSNLLIHVKSAHKNIRYECETCEKPFTQLGSLYFHIRRVHEGLKHSKEVEPKEKVISHECELCKKVFTVEGRCCQN